MTPTETLVSGPDARCDPPPSSITSAGQFRRWGSRGVRSGTTLACAARQHTRRGPDTGAYRTAARASPPAFCRRPAHFAAATAPGLKTADVPWPRAAAGTFFRVSIVCIRVIPGAQLAPTPGGALGPTLTASRAPAAAVPAHRSAGRQGMPVLPRGGREVSMYAYVCAFLLRRGEGRRRGTGVGRPEYARTPCPLAACRPLASCPH